MIPGEYVAKEADTRRFCPWVPLSHVSSVTSGRVGCDRVRMAFPSFADYSQDEKALLGACDCTQSKCLVGLWLLALDRSADLTRGEGGGLSAFSVTCFPFLLNPSYKNLWL